MKFAPVRMSSEFQERSPIVDGEELPDGYGTLFEQGEVFDVDLLDYGKYHLKPGSNLRAWITKQDWNGEYQKFRDVTGSTILVWDAEGRAWEYEGGVLRIIDDGLDLESEYGDE